MSAAADIQPSTPLQFARHIVGMMILALANPLIYYGGGFYQWSVTFAAPLLGAGVVYGLYALFFTKRAKAAWPGSFFVLTWVMLVLALFQGWTGPTREPQNTPAQLASDPPPKGQTFTYEEAYGLPPAKN